MADNLTPGELFHSMTPSPGRTRTVSVGAREFEVQIIGQLGRGLDVFDVRSGGHGEVFLCARTESSDPATALAAKMLPRNILLDPVRRRAFIRECLLAVQLSALPGFVSSQIHEIHGMPALVMLATLPDADGVVNLRDLVQGRPIPAALIAFLAWCIADSMAMGDTALPGLVHGDLKPENILMFVGTPHIADFGVARSLRHGTGRDTMAGTPAYLAPEARRPGAELTQATDVFAFGRILEDLLGNAALHADRETVDLLARVAGHCMAIAPSDRPQTFREVADELRPLFDENAEPVENRYLARQLLGMQSMSFSAVFPDTTIESLIALRQWDLVLDAIERHPADTRDAYLWHKHGLALTCLGRDEESHESLRIALARAEYEIETFGQLRRYGPDAEPHPILSILFDLAQLHLNMGELDQAARMLENLIQEPGTPAYFRRRTAEVLAVTVSRMGQFDRADTLLLSVAHSEENPDAVVENIVLRAQIRRENEQAITAVELLQGAIAARPGKARFHAMLGETLLLDLGQAELAAVAYENALLCGDLSTGILAGHLGCRLLSADDEQAADRLREEAGQRFGPDLVDVAWPSALRLVQLFRGAVDAEPASPATGSPAHVRDHGDVRIDVNDVGFYTFDIYHSHDDDGFLELLASRYTHLTTTFTLATMRGTPIVFTQCVSCHTDVTTNRPVGSAYLCRECGVLNHVVPLIGGRYAELRRAADEALSRTEDPADGQICCVVVQPSSPASEHMLEQAHELARTNGLEPASPDHPAVFMAYLREVSRGNLRVVLQPIGAVYRFPAGSRHCASLTPAPVENYLMDVRRHFGVRVESISARIDLAGHDFTTLIYSDRLDDAERLNQAEPDVGIRQYHAVFLAHLRLIRNDVSGAGRCAAEAIRLDETDAAAWVAKGYAEMLSGRDDEAQFCVQRALEIDALGSSALALLAALQHWSGEEVETVRTTLSRAIALGTLRLNQGL